MHDLIALELSVEREVCRRHPAYGGLFDEALAQKKRVVLISDIYLPYDHVAEVLRDAGYRGYERLFVSSCEGTNKASGRLFPLVASALEVDPSRIVHFGDDEDADVAKARAAGFKALQVERGERRLRAPQLVPSGIFDGSEALNESVMLGLFKNRAWTRVLADQRAPDKVAFQIGYQVLGPLCYGFARWCATHAASRGIEKLCFVSREGWFLKQVYDELAPIWGCRVPSEYFHASRRALYMALAEPPYPESVSALLGKLGPLRSYLESVEIDPQGVDIETHGFRRLDDWVNQYIDPSGYSRLVDLFGDHRAHLEQQCIREREGYLSYLKSLGFERCTHVGFIDSGWYGSSQRALTKLMQMAGLDCRITGLYIALAECGRKNFDARSDGLGFVHHFFQDGGGRDLKGYAELACVLEVLLSAPSPSLRRMRITEEGPKPVYVTDPARTALHPNAAAIQRGALAFVREFASEGREGYTPTVSAETATKLIQHLVDSPDPVRARVIGSLPYDPHAFNVDRRGVFLPDTDEEGHPLDGSSVLRRPKALFDAFHDSNWRRGFYSSRTSPLARSLLRTFEPCLWTPDGAAARAYHRSHRLARRVKHAVQSRN